MRSIEVDISAHIGLFSPTLFIYLTNISEINIAGCRFIDAELFGDTIVYCKVLCKLDMQSCNQFSESHFVRFLPKMQELQYLDLAKCCNIGFEAVLWIIQETTKLESINFDPNKPVDDMDMWKIMLTHFRRIHFGHNVRCCMPHYGNVWRIPDWSDEN